MAILKSEIDKLIAKKKSDLINKKIIAWIMMFSSNKGEIKSFDGTKISYPGIKFEGSPREVFWSRFIEPFIEDFIDQMILYVRQETEENNLNFQDEISYLNLQLKRMNHSIFTEMQKTDIRIMNMFNRTTDKVNIESYIRSIDEYVDESVQLAMHKDKSRHSIKTKILKKIEEHFVLFIVGIIFIAPMALFKYMELGVTYLLGTNE